MKKTVLFAALFLAIGAVAVPAMAGEGGKKQKANLTEIQKKCIASHECPKFSKEEKATKSETEINAKNECRKKAFEDCGVEMPAFKSEKM